MEHNGLLSLIYVTDAMLLYFSFIWMKELRISYDIVIHIMQFTKYVMLLFIVCDVSAKAIYLKLQWCTFSVKSIWYVILTVKSIVLKASPEFFSHDLLWK